MFLRFAQDIGNPAVLHVADQPERACCMLVSQENVLLRYCPGLLMRSDKERPAAPLGQATFSNAAAVYARLLPPCTATQSLVAQLAASPASGPPPAPAGSCWDVLAILGAHVLAIYVLYLCACMPGRVGADVEHRRSLVQTDSPSL